MPNLKNDARDVEDRVKAAARRADGESIADRLANAGDRARHGLERAAETVEDASDKLDRAAAYERGRADGEADARQRGGEPVSR